MLKLLLTAFLSLPLQNFQVNNNNINNDILEYIYKLPTLVLLIPTITRHNDNCKTDDDCALIMRCCEVGKKRYCCTPNNFVKMSLKSPLMGSGGLPKASDNPWLRPRRI